MLTSTPRSCKPNNSICMREFHTGHCTNLWAAVSVQLASLQASDLKAAAAVCATAGCMSFGLSVARACGEAWKLCVAVVCAKQLLCL